MLADRLDYIHDWSGHGRGAWPSTELTPTEVLLRNFWFCIARRPVDLAHPRPHRRRPHHGRGRLPPRRLDLARHPALPRPSGWPGSAVEEQRRVTHANAAELFRHPLPKDVPTVTGLAISDEHVELAATARALARRRATCSPRRAPCSSAAPTSCPPWWPELAELGWAGLAVSEEHGGSGLRDRRAGGRARGVGRALPARARSCPPRSWPPRSTGGARRPTSSRRWRRAVSPASPLDSAFAASG